MTSVVTICSVISASEGYAVSFGAILFVYRLENGQYAVDYEDGQQLFAEPEAAVAAFLKIRHEHQVGFDYETSPVTNET